MGRVYAVASAKGGVGKTTTTANLGAALAAAGHRVAVVDADLGMPNLGRTLGLPPADPTLHDVLAGDAALQAAVADGPHGLTVVPGAAELGAYATADPKALPPVVRALADAHDVVLLDTGAGLSHDTLLPVGVADAVLLVSTPSPDAVGDTAKTRQLAARVESPVTGLILTRADPEPDVDGLLADVDASLLGVVPDDPAVTAATADGDPVVTHDPDSPAATAYRDLAETVAASDPATAGGAPPDAPVATAAESASGARETPDADDASATTGGDDAAERTAAADATAEPAETHDDRGAEEGTDVEDDRGAEEGTDGDDETAGDSGLFGRFWG